MIHVATDAERVLQGDTVLPPPAEWSPVAVRLLQGVVYHDDSADKRLGDAAAERIAADRLLCQDWSSIDR